MKLTNPAFLPKRATDIYISLLLLVYPLFPGFEGYSHITKWKLIFILVLTLLWLTALLVFAASGKNRRIKTPGTLPLQGILLLIYAGISCISALTSSYGPGAVLTGAGRFDGLLHTLLCTAVFCCTFRWGRFKTLHGVFLCVSVSLCCIIAGLQLAGFNPLGLYPGNCLYYHMGTRYTGEFLGTIGNGNLFSAFLCMSLTLISCLYVKGLLHPAAAFTSVLLGGFCIFECTVFAGKLALLAGLVILMPFFSDSTLRLGRILKILGIFMGAFGLSLSFSGTLSGDTVLRSFAPSGTAWALMAGGAILFPLSWLIRKKEFSLKKLRLSTAVFSGLLLLGALAGVYFTNSDAGTVYELSQVLRGNVSESFGSSRIRIWKETWELIKEQPLLGGGPGTLSLRLDIDFFRFVESSGITLKASVDNAHNVYLGILADCGPLALAAFLGAMGVTLAKAFLRFGSRSPLALCLAGGLLVYWIQDFFGLGLFFITPLAFAVWGLASKELAAPRSAVNKRQIK